MSEQHHHPRLYPWYVHIVGGYCVGAILPWYLTCRQLYSRGRKKAALLMMTVTVLCYGAFIALSLHAAYSWEKLTTAFLAFHLIWSALAWGVQRRTCGPAPRRYYGAEWRSWLPPVAIAVVLGIGVAVTISIFPLIGERAMLYRSQDLLAKKVILWDFFRTIPVSLLYSLPLGLWWAGERRWFRSSTVLVYSFGLLLFTAIFSAMNGLFYFVLSDGQFVSQYSAWSVISSNPDGVAGLLNFLSENDYSTIFFVPLLLGATVSLSGFWKRSLVIFPALSAILLLSVWFSPQHWQFYQNQILYEMASEKPAERARAAGRVWVMLHRFPEHDGWPAIAEQAADYYYRAGKADRARQLYTMIALKTQDSPRWYEQAAMAESALASPFFGKQENLFSLSMPSLHYESYMTMNWMAMLRVMRWYDSQQGGEVDTLIKLKEISEDDDKIELGAMPALAELDDFAGSLGLSVLILPSKLNDIKRLVRAGYPVIQPVGDVFQVLNGIDEGRRAMTGFSYRHVMAGLKKNDKEGVGEGIFGDEEPGAASSTERIDNLAATTIPFSFWQKARQEDLAPFLALVVPPEKIGGVAGALGMARQELERAGKSRLAAMIALNMVQCSDVMQAIEWAMRSHAMEHNPLALHVAHLAEVFWQSRHNKLGTSLELERRFPELAMIEGYFARPTVKTFLAEASGRFARDFEHRSLGWKVRSQYRDFLDAGDPDERAQLRAIAEMNVKSVPDSRSDWLQLAAFYAWDDNNRKMVESYKGALGAGAWDDEIALKLAYGYVRTQCYDTLEEIVAMIDSAQVKYSPDYYYCLATLAKRKKDYDSAVHYYEKAIRMRRYDKHYHLDYADMLERTGGEGKKIARLRAWAARLENAPEGWSEVAASRATEAF